MSTAVAAIGTSAQSLVRSVLDTIEPNSIDVIAAFKADGPAGRLPRHPGAVDASPTPSELRFEWDPVTGEYLGYKFLAEKVVAALGPATAGRILTILDSGDAQAIGALREIATRVCRPRTEQDADDAATASPRHVEATRHRQRTVAVLQLPNPGQRDERLHRTLDRLTDAWKEAALVLTILLDECSLLAQRHGALVQERMVAAMLSALLTKSAAPFWEATDARFGSSPFYGLNVAVRPVVPARDGRMRGLARKVFYPFKVPTAGPDFQDAIRQILRAIDEVLVGGVTQASVTGASLPDPASPALLLCVVPRLFDDRRLGEELVKCIQRSVSQFEARLGARHRTLVPVFVSGQGAPDSDPVTREAKYRVQVGLLWPLGGLPASFVPTTDAGSVPSSHADSAPSSHADPEPSMAGRVNGHRSTHETFASSVAVLDASEA